jgi:ABC-type molybdenum transport system ATPase subunit/photorepair protein PhrA
MGLRNIVIRGARQHNLKNISLEIPRYTLTVITGLSGSGKSSLAFDTLYAEGQRRYVESLSAYARQFLDQMERPDVDAIEGLSPSIAIELDGGHHHRNLRLSARDFQLDWYTPLQQLRPAHCAAVARADCAGGGDSRSGRTHHGDGSCGART